MAAAGCGLRYLFRLVLVRFKLLRILIQSIDKYLFSIPMKIHTMVLKIKKENNFIFSALQSRTKYLEQNREIQ